MTKKTIAKVVKKETKAVEKKIKKTKTEAKRKLISIKIPTSISLHLHVDPNNNCYSKSS